MRALFREVRLPRTDEEAARLSSEMRKLRRGCMLWSYEPHPKQRLFHAADNPIRIFCGSNQSGKTTALLAELISLCLGYRPWDPSTYFNEFRPIQAMLAANDFVNAHTEVIVPKMRELIPFDQLVSSTDRLQGKVIHKVHFWNGSTIKLMGYEQPSDKYEGPTWDVVACDEPPTHPIWVAMQRGCMARGAPALLAFTPLKEAWIYDQLYSKGFHAQLGDLEDSSRLEEMRRSTVFSVTIDLDENPYITEERKDLFIAGLDPDEREARVHGRFRHLMGRVYKRFDPERHVRDVEIDETWPSGCVIDPHSRRPFFIGWFVVTPRDEIVWVAEWPDEFLYHECKSYDANIEWYANRIREVEGGDNALGFKFRHVAWRILDPRFGRQPSAIAGVSIQEEFERHGLDFEVDFNDSFDTGRLKLNEYLAPRSSDPMMFWHNHMTNMITAMSHCTWDDWGGKVDRAVKERVKDKFSDGTDVARYAAIWEPLWFDVDRIRGPELPVDLRNMGLG